MKKVLSLFALMMLFVFTANAQQRKTWDFTKGVSDESRALLDGDATWTKTAPDGVTTSWVSAANINGEAKAGDQVIKEFAGLEFGQFAAVNAVNYLVNRLRLQKDCSFSISGLTAGQQIVLKAQSANATATDRGFGFENAAIVEGPENGIVLGRDAADAPEGGVTTFVLKVSADGAVKFSTGVNGAPKSGVEVLSIIIDGGDKNIKKWDFSAFSDATKAQVLAATDWTAKESDAKDYLNGGNQIRWINTVNFDANDDLMAGGAAIKELQGLRHAGLAQYGMGLAFDYQNLLDGNQEKGWGPYNGASYLWVMGKNSTITIPNVKAGSTLKLGVETHKLLPAGTSDARGFQVLVNDVEVGTTKKATAYEVFEYTIPEGDNEFVNVVLKATAGCHLYSIEAEVKDESFVDKNPALGNPVYSIANNSKISLESKGFTITFPKFKNIEAVTKVTIDGYFAPVELPDGAKAEDYFFDGLDFAVTDGVEFNFADYEAEITENTKYEFYITKIAVAGYDMLNKEAAEGEKLFPINFQTSGPGIEKPRAWNFTTTAEQAAELAGSSKWAASSKGRYSWPTPMTYGQLMIDDEKAFSVTDGLYFSMGTANDILIGTPDGNNGKLQLGGGSPDLIIPSCSEGDEITIKALWSTKNSGVITITNGTCEGNAEFSVTGSAAEYKIIVTGNDDVVLKSKNVVYQEVSVYPASMGKEKVVYTINATDADGNILKEIATGEGQSNDKVDYNFSYYLMDKDGKFYTKGTRGVPFSESVTLATGKETYNVEYKAKNFDGCVKGVFCAEAEDLEGTIASTSANCGIRASMGKAAYPDAGDVTLCTLPAGTYKINALVWDANKGGGVATMKFAVGDNPTPLEIISTGDNMSEVEADLILEAPAQIVWLKEGTGDATCLDAIMIYQYDPTGVAEVAADAAAAKAVKVVENNAIVVKTAQGTFNVAGAQMK